MTKQILKYRFNTLGVRLFPRIHSINCKLELGPLVSYGRGDSQDLTLAKKKSFSEALERLALKKGSQFYQALDSPKSSNGLAFHFDRDLAKINSKNELIEREVVLKAWAFGRLVKSVNCDSFLIENDFVIALGNKLKNQYQVDMMVLNFGKVGNTFVIGCAIISDQSPHLMIGYSAQPSVSRAIEKAALEVCIIFERYKLSSERILFLDETDALKNRCVKNIIYYAENQHDITDVFPGVVKSNKIDDWMIDIDITKIPQKVYDMNQVGISGYLARSTHCDFFEFRAGPLTSKFGNRKIGEVHPIG